MRINEISLTREFNILNSELATILTTLKGSKDLLTIRKCNFEYELKRDKINHLYYMVQFIDTLNDGIKTCFEVNHDLVNSIANEFFESRERLAV